jgi:hypothetical protein
MADNARETIARALCPHRVDHNWPDYLRHADAILAAQRAAGQTYEDGVRTGMEKAVSALAETWRLGKDNRLGDVVAAIRAAAPTTGGDA